MKGKSMIAMMVNLPKMDKYEKELLFKMLLALAVFVTFCTIVGNP